MNTDQAIKDFGSIRSLADVLGISVQAVYKWNGTVPALRVYQLNEIKRNKVTKKKAA